MTSNTNIDELSNNAEERYALSDRRMIALQSLSDLSRQFADNADFNKLIELVLLTLSGQFAFVSGFVVIFRSSLIHYKEICKGIGKYEDVLWLNKLVLQGDDCDFIESLNKPKYTAELTASYKADRVIDTMMKNKVHVIAPILQGAKVIGLVGLGPTVSSREYREEDLELLSALLDSISPLIVNSFIFSEVNHLNTWYLNILDNVTLGMFVFDHTLHLKKINMAGQKALERLLSNEKAFNPTDILTINDIFPSTVFPGWVEEITCKDKSEKNQQFDNLRAAGGGEKKVFNVRVSTADSSENELPDVVVIIEDVTEQNENEARFFDLEKFAEKGVMASSLAHELNNFLGLILGGVEMSEIALGKGKTEKTIDHLSKLKSHVGKMERFTAGLMDFTRVEAKMDLQDINIIISDVLSFVRAQDRFSGVRVSAKLDNELPKLKCDGDQISQLLLNFLNNAADAIVETKRTDGLVTISTSIENEQIQLSVSDNGNGIDPELRERLFQSRFTTKASGHGYGLVTCGKILDNHKAEIEIQSELGTGSTFIIKFPASETSSVQS